MMRSDKDYLEGLLELWRQPDMEERKAAWRQSVATLAAAVTNQRRPVPLEGLNPQALLSSVRVAMGTGLVDDLDWLSPAASAAALYELAAALPPSNEKRELGRRVLKRLHEGDAETFVALATQLALGSRRALSGAPIRARVALSLDLPLGAGPRVDGLALALISRRDLEREWLRIPSTGSLPARRLAARLLERAARETAGRVAEGDDSGLRVFNMSTVESAWQRLLADRESLVWRHVATARGLLSEARPELAEAIHRDLDAGLSPTEWRRAAASLTASIAVTPERSLNEARALISSPIMRRDPGTASAMIIGLPRAAEAHPDAVEELLEQLVRVGGLGAAEALVELQRERLGHDFGDWASQLARAELRESLLESGDDDDGRIALLESVAHELSAGGEGTSLRDRLGSALTAFAERGAAQAYAEARQLLSEARARVELLEAADESIGEERRRSFQALRELDLALCETDTLANLLLLGVRGEQPGAELRPLGDLFDRINTWLLRHEGEPIRDSSAIAHPTLRMRRLRAMLHLIDADGTLVDDRTERLQERRLTDALTLFERVRDEPRNGLRRALCAATARAADAIVREEFAEVSDVVLVAGLHVAEPEDLEVLAEASMVPDIEAALRAYYRLARVVTEVPTSGRGVRASLDALITLANELPVASSARVEALRAALLELGRSLEGVAAAGSLTALAEGATDGSIPALERAVAHFGQLLVGARRRLGDLPADDSSAASAIRLIDICLERALKDAREPLEGALASAEESLRLEMPQAIAEVIVVVLERARTLPVESQARRRLSFLPAPPKEAPLPPWVPPGRSLGGFFVVRALSAGAVGTVFVARRVEQRRDPKAERFALKVPEYDAAAARTLSEDQFLQLFREEAGALLALPRHPNIARFVTFDAGAKPKPILVMELVEGPTLERLIELGELSMDHAMAVLQGVAAGLEAMHSVGVGHLDVKPSNVILRETHDGGFSEPVLVDFGLAGRHVRPGCGTAEYGAPELWSSESRSTRPMPVDVYAFGCMIYEVLTARTLFTGPHETALITQHLTYDGVHPDVVQLQDDPRTARLGQLLRSMLRRDPDRRADIRTVRRELQRLSSELEPYAWPLGEHGAAVQPTG